MVLQQLADIGYITRFKNERDRRVTHIRVTEKGLETVEKYIKCMDELMLKKLSVLEIDELVKLSNAFSTIKEIFDKIETLKP